MEYKHILRRLTLTLIFSPLFALFLSGAARADMVMLSPSADTYVDSGYPSGNFGDDVMLISRYDAESDRRAMPFLKFDFSLIPAGSTINEATLKMYLKDMRGRETIKLKVFRATSDWTEEGLVWNNKPTGPSLDQVVTLSDNKGNKNLDVTEFVSGWLAGTYPDYGLFIDYAGAATYSLVLSGSEAPKNQPYLVVYYTPPSSGTGVPKVGLSMASGKPPAIMAVTVADVKKDSVTINWMTDMKADSQIRFGKSAAYDYETKSSKDVTSHSMVLRGLSPGNEYHFRVYSTSPADMTASSPDLQFKTAGVPRASTILPSTPFGWLKLTGLIAGAVSVFLLMVVGAVELQRWRHSLAGRKVV